MWIHHLWQYWHIRPESLFITLDEFWLTYRSVPHKCLKLFFLKYVFHFISCWCLFPARWKLNSHCEIVRLLHVAEMIYNASPLQFLTLKHTHTYSYHIYTHLDKTRSHSGRRKETGCTNCELCPTRSSNRRPTERGGRKKPSQWKRLELSRCF